MTAIASSSDQSLDLEVMSSMAGSYSDVPATRRIAAALDALRVGRPVLVADDSKRENEIDVVLDAATVTPHWLAWTIRHSSGYLCAPMSSARADALDLPLMVASNQDPLRTAYTVSVDAMSGVTTGISAADRSHTLNVLADPASTAASLIRPGHILPLRAKPGGVVERPGHTEAGVDLVALSHGNPWLPGREDPHPPVNQSAASTTLRAGDVIAACRDLAVAGIGELVRDDGEMMRMDDGAELAAKFGLVLITIEELRDYIVSSESNAERVPVQRVGSQGKSSATNDMVDADVCVVRTGEARLPTRHGEFTIASYRELRTGIDHVALVHGLPCEDPLVRVHSECLTGEAFGSTRCDCGPQLDAALAAVAREGGAVIYLRGHEGRGIGIAAKVDAYALQDAGQDTVDANLELGFAVDLRDYSVAAAILRDLELHRIRLMSNNPDKELALQANGIEISDTVRLNVGRTSENLGYLRTKVERLGHHIHGIDDVGPALPDS